MHRANRRRGTEDELGLGYRESKVLEDIKEGSDSHQKSYSLSEEVKVTERR